MPATTNTKPVSPHLSKEVVMQIEIDPTVAKIAAPFFIIGFGLVWWQAGFWVALGVSFLCIAFGVRRIAG